jgi:diadenosine tetraphosphate (Ap4A) HIT family hydrolase
VRFSSWPFFVAALPGRASGPRFRAAGRLDRHVARRKNAAMQKPPAPKWDHLPWEAFVRGENCPLCPERVDQSPFWVRVGPLSAANLFLNKDQRYGGYSQLIFSRRHVTGIDQLTDEEYAAYMGDLRATGRALIAVFHPDHMNYECQGNFVPHLHFNIIPRYQGDVRWRMPIQWGWKSREEYEAASVYVSDEEHAALRSKLRDALGIPAP